MIARLLFAAAPAVAVGAVVALIHPAAGAITAICVFGLGWQVTAAQRGEGE